MAEELVVQAPAEPSAEQKRTKVWQHPDRDRIIAMLRRGRSAAWISAWLEEMYPLEDETGEPHEEATRHRRWQITEETIERYRDEYMPEVAPGIDYVDEGLEDLIGRTMPVPSAPQLEVELMHTALRVAQQNLARSLEQDEEMGMLQPTTLDAHAKFVETIKASAGMKQALNLPGYERAPEHQIIESTNKNLSVELHGKVDQNGNVTPGDPEKVSALKQLLELGPERAGEIMEQAERQARQQAAVDAEAEEVSDGGES